MHICLLDPFCSNNAVILTFIPVLREFTTAIPWSSSKYLNIPSKKEDQEIIQKSMFSQLLIFSNLYDKIITRMNHFHSFCDCN